MIRFKAEAGCSVRMEVWEQALYGSGRWVEVDPESVTITAPVVNAPAPEGVVRIEVRGLVVP